MDPKILKGGGRKTTYQSRRNLLQTHRTNHTSFTWEKADFWMKKIQFLSQ